MEKAYAARLEIDFWDGLTSVRGYKAIRLWPAIALQPGANQITVTAEDIKGMETRRTVTIQNGDPRPQNGARHRAKRVGQRLAAATPTLSGRRVRLVAGALSVWGCAARRPGAAAAAGCSGSTYCVAQVALPRLSGARSGR